MSEKFIDSFTDVTNYTWTENGAVAKATTKSSVLDFFAQGGALRNRNEDEILRLLSAAINEDKLLATRAMFYFRDIRGGQGEREVFRKQLKWMAFAHPEIVRKNITLIPFYGRWDDLYALFDTELENDAIATMAKQFAEDVGSAHPSLLAKWLKSENTSSKESRRLARKTRIGFGLSPKQYRKTLSSLRAKIEVVEQLISANKWSEVKYENVPSQANLKYEKAFLKHDKHRRKQYLASLVNGETKINASALYPYEIVRRAHNINPRVQSEERVLVDALWKALPDYIGNVKENAIAVVDVSGSMHGLPLNVALSIGLYLAEHNTTPAYHNKFITFSAKPQLVNITGNDLVEKLWNMERSHWDMNTDVHAVFRLILDVAVKNNLKQDEIPGRLYIITDMEFDACATGLPGETYMETFAREYEEHGYKLPELVFWNVNARHSVLPVDKNHQGVIIVSGCSPSTFEYVMNSKNISPYEMMLKILNNKRYLQIQV